MAERATSLASAVSSRGSAALWYAFFGGPVIWFTVLCVTYFIVTPACHAGTELFVHVVYVLGVGAGIGAALAGATLWRRSDAHWPDDGGGRRDRTRFMAAVGALLSSLFTLVVLAQWLAAILHSPCAPAPRLPDSPDAVVQPAAAPFVG